jgi:hypothetical protein
MRNFLLGAFFGSLATSSFVLVWVYVDKLGWHR